PAAADSASMPRREITRQRPAGPTTHSRSGLARVLSTGHSFGDCQANGPNSPTMIVKLSRRTSGETGARRGPPMLSGESEAYAVGSTGQAYGRSPSGPFPSARNDAVSRS